MVIRQILNTLAAIFFLMPSMVSADASRLAEAFAVDAERDARNILDSLSLSFTQKSEIQSILLAAMQSMDVVNAQIDEMQARDANLLSEDIQLMIQALRQQRVQLAEMLAVEILSVLTPQQRSKLKLTPDIKPAIETDSGGSVRKYEI